MTVANKKKLIEVAIPLEIINAASAREKSIRHGHPSTLHLWWARRPLVACRAVLFAQLVDDPSSHTEAFPTPEEQERERKRLFGIIEDLVKWENSTNEEVLERARVEIRRSCGGVLPPVYDPFSGGGSIPLEAQRLGLPAYGSDLNPVAVTIGKALISIPPKFKNASPVHPDIKARSFYRNAEGLAEDVKYYSDLMREKAWKRVGHLYPLANVPAENGGGKATVIAWIWARTIPSPDPAFSDVHVPIASSFVLSSKPGREAWVEPIIEKSNKSISYKIKTQGTKEEISVASQGTKAGRGANFRCLISNTAITPDYVKSVGKSGKLGQTLIAVVVEGPQGRLYLPPSLHDEEVASAASPTWHPEIPLPRHSQYIGVLSYGFDSFGDLYTNRQLSALEAFSDAAVETWKIALEHACNVLPSKDDRSLNDGGMGAVAYADAIRTYLSFLVSQVANHSTSVCGWNSPNQQMRSTFSRQAISMTWDYAEVNPFSTSSGSFHNLQSRMVKGFETLGASSLPGIISQLDAQNVVYSNDMAISTDPPYYDNIPYADLSDLFYEWLRRLLQDTYPDIFSTLAVPKMEELVADRMRHNGAEKADAFFLDGMSSVFSAMAKQTNAEIPCTVYYAFRQSEIEQEGVSSTGWATFIQAILDAGYALVGTWPMRTEKPGRMRAVGANALANSVVLVCRKRESDAEIITRAEFIRHLKRELPPAINELQAANIAPADMPQSAIGPGVGVFSRYKAVLESDDSPMSVKTALQLINKELDEYLGGIQGEFDADTRFTIFWFEQNGLKAGDYGTANSIAQARGISVDSIKHAGIVESQASKVRILRRDELDDKWEPGTDQHLTIWECLQHLVRLHEKDGISHATAMLLKKIGDKAEAVKDLAYILYDISANKRQDAKEATAYNALIADWTELSRQAAAIHETRGDLQQRLDF